MPKLMNKRSSHRYLLLSVIACLFSAGVSYPIYAEPAKRQTVQDDAFSLHEALELRLAYNQQTLVQAYRDHGHRDPAWDQVALNYLEKWAYYFTYSSNHGSDYTLAPLLSINDKFRKFSEMRDDLLRAGCTDPMVTYLMAGDFLNEGENEKALELYIQAFREFVGSDYSAHRKFYSAERLLETAASLRSTPQLKQQRQQWEQAWIKYFVEGVGEAEKQEHFAIRDFLISSYLGSLDSRVGHPPSPDAIALMNDLLEELETIKADSPWSYHAARTGVLIELAWAHRGHGLAGGVRDDQWREFEKHLTVARQDGAKAWKIMPTQVIARNMITIAMAGHAQRGENERLWFDRSLELQFDDAATWSHMTLALRPRWGGSHARMLQLAIEAVDTGRFDTALPYRAVTLLQAIEQERGDARYWAHPKAVDALERLTLGMQHEESRPDDATWYIVMRAAFMWKAQAYDKALAALEEAKQADPDYEKHLDDAFKRVNVSAEEAVREIRAKASRP